MASNELKGNAVVGQSGGPTAVINASLVGVIEGLRPAVEAGTVGKIFGAVHAVSGMKNDRFIELQDLPQDRLNRLAETPSSGLGSSRDKPDVEYCKQVIDILEKKNVRYFFYIGGNDSSDTCRIINEEAAKHNYELRAFHVPKTIDNDLMVNDHTPGYGSAAKFVAQAFQGDNLDNKALPGVKINIVMGRHAGFLTAAAMLGKQHDEDGPHLVYVPEATFDEQRFAADIDGVLKKHGRCLIAVSEGIHDAEGSPMITKLQENVEKDAHGNVQLSGTGALGDLLSGLVKEKLGVKRVRADTFGYLQRSFAGCLSKVDQAEARAAGKAAAEAALRGDRASGSIAIIRTSDDPYSVEYRTIDIKQVAALTKHLDPKYILDGCRIDESFRDYTLPLTGGLPHVEQLRLKG